MSPIKNLFMGFFILKNTEPLIFLSIKNNHNTTSGNVFLSFFLIYIFFNFMDPIFYNVIKTRLKEKFL